MQATENGPRQDQASDGTVGVPGRGELQAPVGTFRVGVLDERSKHRPEMLLVDDDQVVEALVPEGADDTLGDRIGAGRLHWTEQSLDAQAPGPTA